MNKKPIKLNKNTKGPNIFGSPIKLATHWSCMVPYSVMYGSSFTTSLQYSTASENKGALIKSSIKLIGILKVLKLNKTGIDKK